MPGISTEYLAEQIEATNGRLEKALETLNSQGTALRAELADLDKGIGKINTSLAWMKGLTAFVGLSVLGMFYMAYQAGNQVGKIESAIGTLQKTTEEIKAELKSRDDRFVVAVTAMQKSADESREAIDDLKIRLKGHSDDVVRLQASVDRFNGGIDKINETVLKAMAKMAR